MNSNASRAPAPVPLRMDRAADRAAGYARSDADMAPRTCSTPAYFSPSDRKESSSSTSSGGSTSSTSSSSAAELSKRDAATRRSSAGPPEGKKPHSPTANVYTYCGRHTDQYLLGGWTDVLTGIFKKD